MVVEGSWNGGSNGNELRQGKRGGVQHKRNKETKRVVPAGATLGAIGGDFSFERFRTYNLK